MSRLIATDLDGTVLPEGTFDINPEYFEVIRKLHDQGDVVVAASGRHYTSIKGLLEPVWKDIIFLCGNGTYVACRGVSMDVKALDSTLYREVLSMFREAEDGFLCADTADSVWTDTDNDAFFREMSGGYKMSLKRYPDLAKLDDRDLWMKLGREEHPQSAEILKLAVHIGTDAGPLAERVKERFGERANIMAAGERWVDCVPLGADKGSALAKIQRQLGFSREDTVAFGDNGNDIGMLKLAGESFCVANGREEVKQAASHVIGEMKDDAVLKELKKFIHTS